MWTEGQAKEGRVGEAQERPWLLSAYRTMVLIREFEETVARLFADGRIPGFVHLSTGQEAVAVGACCALGDSDWMATTHRGHGHCIARGLSLRSMIAEILGKATGVCRGQGGSMHVSDIARGMLGANGVVGAGVPIAVGAGLAEQLRDSGGVSMAFLGDGAVATGAFHEAVNLAAAWRLPVVFVCEHNGYAEFTRADDLSPVAPPDRASAYGIPAAEADGNDVEKVFYACRRAVDRARRGEGPALIEARTYRLRGHYEGDPATYRDEAEITAAVARDPLILTAARLRDLGVAEDDLTAVCRDAEREVADAVAFAEASPDPDPDGHRRTVYGPLPAPTPASGEGPRTGRYMDAIAMAIAEEMERDERVFLMGVDVLAGGGVYGVTRPLARFGPRRVRDAPISETAILGAGVGAALAGLRPIVEVMFMDFLAVCLDQLINQAAKLRSMSGGGCSVPLVVRTQTGAGRSAGPQHSQSWEAIVAHVPGLLVVMPSTPRDARGLLRAAIRTDDPVVFIEHRMLYRLKGDLGPDVEIVPIGRAATVRTGRDVTVVSWGRMVHEALDAARRVEEEGISTEVIDLRTVQPYDVATVTASVERTGRLLVVHEAVTEFGAGAEIAARVQEEAFGMLDAPVGRLGAPFAPTPFTPTQERRHVPDAEAIRRRLLELARF